MLLRWRGPCREEHHAELVDDEVETSGGERQILCICLLEGDLLGADALCGELDHRRVEVSRDDLRLRYRLIHCTGNDAGAGGGLEDAGRLEERRALGDEPRIGLEQQRAQVAVVKRGRRMLEGCACLSHRNGPFKVTLAAKPSKRFPQLGRPTAPASGPGYRKAALSALSRKPSSGLGPETPFTLPTRWYCIAALNLL